MMLNCTVYIYITTNRTIKNLDCLNLAVKTKQEHDDGLQKITYYYCLQYLFGT